MKNAVVFALDRPPRRLDKTGPGRHSLRMSARKDWARLGTYVVRRRFERGYQDRQAFAEATGIHYRTLGKVETGNQVGRNTLAAIEVALAWGPGSCEAILAGGEPTEIPAAGRNEPDRPALHDALEVTIWSDPDLTVDDRWALIHYYRGMKRRRMGDQSSA